MTKITSDMDKNLENVENHKRLAKNQLENKEKPLGFG